MRATLALAFVACVAVVTVSASVRANTGNGPVVETIYGSAQGVMDQGVYAFKGIPFAQPPIGNLRFAAPEPATPWSGVLDATTFRDGCMTTCPPTSMPRPEIMCTPKVSEDCLFLNVFTPSLNATDKLPVIMFIHGGNYKFGSGGVPIYDGAALAKAQNVVVVTINYRLGILGGLFTGTLKGNFQTMDQRQAMIWINKAISAFGGNPNLVTISGQSAGAFSIATHLSSPPSWPYFQRAIIISDPLSLLALDAEKALELGNKFLTKVGCPMGGDLELDCLRKLNATDIITIQNHTDFTPEHGQALIMMMPWVPVVDGDQLPYQPLYALTNEKFNKVPVMFGTVANESVQFVYDLSRKPLPSIGYYGLLDLIFGFKNLTKINKEYGDVPHADRHDARMWMSPMVTDFIFYSSNTYVGTALTKVVPTFMWLFDKVGTWNDWAFGKDMEYCVHNVCHASDLPFIFNPFKAPMPASVQPVPQPTEAESELIHFMQSAWGNFARAGDPNSSPLPQNIVWPRYNGTINNVVNESTPVSVLSNYRAEQVSFWEKMGFYRF